MRALAPALLALLFGAWCGTSWGGVGLAGAVAAEASLLAAAVAAGAVGLDPLRLGPAGRFLPCALWAAVAASTWASPVPRAGRVAVVLLPAFFLVPGLVERCWREEEARRLGLRALAVAVGAVALTSLVAIAPLGFPRAAFPLGHHNLLAAWLALLLPLAVLPARERGPWRWLGWGAGLSAAAALAASRSLAGALALAAEALCAALLARRLRSGSGPEPHRHPALRLIVLGVIAAALLLTFQAVRIRDVAAGADPSFAARLVYMRGGWEGFRARPLLGWGPGSAAWTAASFLRPEPGINPPGEIVGELHSLPVQLLYELGATGTLLALGLAAAFLRRRLAELMADPIAPAALAASRTAARTITLGSATSATTDRPLLAAGLLGLAGGAAASLASAAVTVTALPLAAALAAGAALAATPRWEPGRPHRGLAFAYALIAILILLPLERARFQYERAIAAPGVDGARRHLAAAVRLDPSFPLYRARLGWLAGASPRDRAAGAALSLRAAEDAPGVAAFWLVAGVRGLRARQPWTEPALRRACALDPLSPFPPFLLTGQAPPQEAPTLAARALLAEPRLAAATLWSRHPELRSRALDEVARWPGVDLGYRAALIDQIREVSAEPTTGARSWLALEADRTPSTSLSLLAFRRRPWPIGLPLIAVRQEFLPKLTLPPATTLRETSREAFPPCRSLKRSSPLPAALRSH